MKQFMKATKYNQAEIGKWTSLEHCQKRSKGKSLYPRNNSAEHKTHKYLLQTKQKSHAKEGTFSHAVEHCTWYLHYFIFKLATFQIGCFSKFGFMTICHQVERSMVMFWNSCPTQLYYISNISTISSDFAVMWPAASRGPWAAPADQPCQPARRSLDHTTGQW